MPNPAHYKGMLETYAEGKDPLAMQSDALRIVAELIGGAPEQTRWANSYCRPNPRQRRNPF